MTDVIGLPCRYLMVNLTTFAAGDNLCPTFLETLDRMTNSFKGGRGKEAPAVISPGPLVVRQLQANQKYAGSASIQWEVNRGVRAQFPTGFFRTQDDYLRFIDKRRIRGLPRQRPSCNITTRPWVRSLSMFSSK
jgi:hypothetical protein